MDTIIEKITEIENITSGIVEGVSTQKQLLDQDQERRIQKFDAALEQETNDQLEALRKQLSGEMEQELDVIRKTSQDQLNERNQWFQDNKEQLAEEIYERIIRK